MCDTAQSQPGDGEKIALLRRSPQIRTIAEVLVPFLPSTGSLSVHRQGAKSRDASAPWARRCSWGVPEPRWRAKASAHRVTSAELHTDKAEKQSFQQGNSFGSIYRQSDNLGWQHCTLDELAPWMSSCCCLTGAATRCHRQIAAVVATENFGGEAEQPSGSSGAWN